jgi:hypothetical protein
MSLKQTLILEFRRNEMLEPPVGAAGMPKDVTFGLLTEEAGVGPSSFCEGNCGAGFGDTAGTALGTRFGT